MSGLDPRDVLELAVRPALSAIGERYATLAAEQLVMGTGALESDGFVKLRQYGHGPARGLWQLEPPTLADMVNRFLEVRVDLQDAVRALCAHYPPTLAEVATNLQLAAALCRIRYLYAKPALPKAGNTEAMERYHKTYYNSAIGKTRPGDFRRAWERYCARLYDSTT